jgi:hypothetical protein
MAATTISCDSQDATGLPRGDSRWLLVWRNGYSAVSSEREPPRGKPVASFRSRVGSVAASVSLTRQAGRILGVRQCASASVLAL